jgi:hypothetical protein
MLAAEEDLDSALESLSIGDLLSVQRLDGDPYARSPNINWRNPQLSHSFCGKAWPHDHELAAIVMAFKRKRIARQQLTRDDASDIEHEVGEPRQARALGMEMPEFEAPPFALVAGVLAQHGRARI